ncbi:PKHD-type hydroxylase At1g22950-like [Aureococcus anophagefferens]|nr:PKHD-type hydroxylase At1g22950-like [Aureococcus anophagefferens]
MHWSVILLLLLALVIFRRRIRLAWRVATKPRHDQDRCAFCGAPDASASSQGELALNLRRSGRLASPEALYAFSRVDRADFLDDDAVRARVAYLDEAVPLGGAAQMSAPHIHAAALDLVVAHSKTRARRSTSGRLRRLRRCSRGARRLRRHVPRAAELVDDARQGLRRHARRRGAATATATRGCALGFRPRSATSSTAAALEDQRARGALVAPGGVLVAPWGPRTRPSGSAPSRPTAACSRRGSASSSCRFVPRRRSERDWPAARRVPRAAPLPPPPPPRPLGQLPTDCACYFSRHYFVKGHGHLDYDGDDAFLPGAVVAPLRAERSRRLGADRAGFRRRRLVAEDLVDWRPAERGFLLDEAGLTPTVTEPLFAYAARLARRLYPDLEALDHHRCFTVEYAVGGDVDLAAHFDNSEVTLNVCLSASADRVGGDLVFGDGTAVAHRPGYAVFHRGSAVHAATELSSGSRTNLVLWCRSTRQRRRTACPLCSETRNLVF